MILYIQEKKNRLKKKGGNKNDRITVLSRTRYNYRKRII